VQGRHDCQPANQDAKMKPYYEQDGIVIYCGDCRDILPTLEWESVTLLWTDPPYGHGNQNGDLQAARVRDGVKGARVREVEPIANDGNEMRGVVEESLRLAAPILRCCCCCCCCCCAGGGGPSVTFAWLANKLDEESYQFFHAVVWDKSGRGHGLGWRFRRNYEFVMVAHRRGGSLSWADDKTAVPNIVFVQPTENFLHPTEKPIELVNWFIGLSTKEGDTVLDPFVGSGTTLRAARDMGRRAIGIEIEEKYCEIAAKRLEQGVFEFT
jgi:site-specific DNA-methyltransferase (adenine-specific)